MSMHSHQQHPKTFPDIVDQPEHWAAPFYMTYSILTDGTIVPVLSSTGKTWLSYHPYNFYW
jgi:hypothetical protein